MNAGLSRTPPVAPAPRPALRNTTPPAVRAARDGWDFSAEFAAYRELAEARETIKREIVSRWDLANAIRVLRTGDDMDKQRADALTRILNFTEREIKRTVGSPGSIWLSACVWIAGGATIVAAIVWGIPLFCALIRWGGEALK